jgi:hypothetical protein
LSFFRKNSLKRDCTSQCYSVNTLLSDISSLSLFEESKDIKDVYASLVHTAQEDDAPAQTSQYSVEGPDPEVVAQIFSAFRGGIEVAAKTLPPDTPREWIDITAIDDFYEAINLELQQPRTRNVAPNSAEKMGEYSAILLYLVNSRTGEKEIDATEYKRLATLGKGLRRSGAANAYFMRNIIESFVKKIFGQIAEEVLQDIGVRNKSIDNNLVLRQLSPKIANEMKNLHQGFDLYTVFVDKYKSVWGQAYPAFIDLYNFVLKNFNEETPLSPTGDPELSFNPGDSEIKVRLDENISGDDEVAAMEGEDAGAIASFQSIKLIRLGDDNLSRQPVGDLVDEMEPTEVGSGDEERLGEMGEFLKKFRGKVNNIANASLGKSIVDESLANVFQRDPEKLDSNKVKDYGSAAELIVQRLRQYGGSSPLDKLNLSVWISYYLSQNG